MSGWFAVARGITSHPLFAKRPDRLAAWIWMLDNAAWKDTRQSVHGDTIDVLRGQFCASQAMMERGTGLSRQALRTLLRDLENEGAIQTAPCKNSTKARTIVTICNYDKYQAAQPSANQEPTKRQPRKEQVNKGTTTEEAKASSPAKRARRLLDDWQLPKSWGEWALSEGWEREAIRAEADRFKDYWIAKSGRDATKLNWEATWRNWMRRVPKTAPGGKAEVFDLRAVMAEIKQEQRK